MDMSCLQMRGVKAWAPPALPLIGPLKEACKRTLQEGAAPKAGGGNNVRHGG